MTGKDAIKYTLNSTQNMLNSYVADLSDADLLERPAASANHIAWQLGHLISAEIHLIKSQLPDAKYPELPAGFAERHSKETASSNEGFGKKADYLNLFEKVRSATLSTLAKLSDADLDRPTKGDMAKFAPTLGALLLLVSNHDLMHAGQFTVVRRKLGKPVIF